MALSNEDQMSSAACDPINAGAVLNKYYHLFHATHESGLRKISITINDVINTAVAGSVTFKIVEIKQDGTEIDVSLALNTLYGSLVPASYVISPANIPKAGAVLDPKAATPALALAPYSGGGVAFSLDRFSDYVVSRGSNIAVKVTAIGTALTQDVIVIANYFIR